MEGKCANCGMSNNLNSRYCSGCGVEINKPELNAPESEDFKAEFLISKRKRKNRNIAGLLAGIIFVLVIGTVTYTAFKKGYIQEIFLQYTCMEANNKCPVMIDPNVRLEGVELLPDRVVMYKYTLVNVLKEEVNIETLQSTAAPEIIKEVKVNPEIAIFRKLDATLCYSYNDRLGIHVWRLDVTPDMYK